MSGLQIALLLIGAVIVVAVLVFNWIQERRFKKQAAAAFKAPVRDVLLERTAVPRHEVGRVEPGLREPVLGDIESASSDEDMQEPRLQIEPVQASAPVMERPFQRPEFAPLKAETAVPIKAAAAPIITSDAPNATPSSIQSEKAPASIASPKPAQLDAVSTPSAPYDDLIEYRVRIGGEGILASVFADAINRTRNFGKAVRWIGLPVSGTVWEEIQPWRDAHYREVQVAMQLADRNGAVQEEELAGLCALLQATVQTHGLKIACDDVVVAVERAQSVDRFCVDVDVLIGLNVVARGEGAMNLAKVLREAENTGMVLGTDGVYQLLDSRGESLYSLCNHDAEPFSHDAMSQQNSQGVTLQFDVPRVPDGLKVFDSMVAFGRKLANEVGGLLVDDNMRPLTDSGIEKIRQQLAHIYERMEARGVSSGSRRALRLFS